MRWWSTEAGAERLEHDRALLAGRHPGLVIDIVDDHVEANGPLIIEVGETEMTLTYQLRLEFPADYAKSAPTAFDAGDAFPHTVERHFMTSPPGACCLWLPVKPRWRADDANALLVFIDEHVAPFFLRQYLYDEGYGWLGPAYSHGWRAYLEYAEDEGVSREQIVRLFPAFRGWDVSSARCLCGSGKLYGACHRDFVRSFRLATRYDVESFLIVVGFEEAFRGLCFGSGWRPWRVPQPARR